MSFRLSNVMEPELEEAWPPGFEATPSFRNDGSAEFEAAVPSTWVGSPEQLQFRTRVLNAHISRTQKRRGPALPDLLPSQLKTVSGTTVSMRTSSAEAAGRLLAAANADLKKARIAGHPDSLRTIRITAASGYRGRAHQRNLWLSYFKSYYENTAAARQSLPGGPHSDAAVSHMLNVFGIPNRIAAPGYSNHQAGIAIDFLQKRTRGNGIGNSYREAAKKKWRATWFYDWLTNNAASFGFQPYLKEPWHWEHRSASTRESETALRASATQSRSSPVPRLSGQILNFTLSSLPVRVAVYWPREAIGLSSVDVVVYAHGLNGGQCGLPAREPRDFITKAPFVLGRIIDESHTGAVLIVPFLDWEHLSQKSLGFGARDRRGLGRWHKAALPANVNRLVQEALSGIGKARGSAPPAARRLIVAGHSRAYDFLDPLASSFADPEMSRGALARLTEVWAFDTAYSCPTATWERFLSSKPGVKLRLFYRPGSATDSCGRAFAAAARLRGARITAPVRVSETHCAVPVRRLPALLAGLAQKATRSSLAAPEFESEQASIGTIVQQLCQAANRIASQTNAALGRLQGNSLTDRWRADLLKRRVANQLNRLSRQASARLYDFSAREIDLLIGCLSRVEHAIGRETLPMQRLRAAARQRLQALHAGLR